ncbi:MAG: glycosyltransferase [Muribaculaceae bacterium]|nr:glycosyltransferase [Muribaculaceae bacterium]
MAPGVSVIVPIYNNETFLVECVESICGQTFSDLQVILVDDGSTDLSGEICDTLAASDPRINVVHTPNCGVSAARNTGVDRATRSHVMFVDSDDAIHPEMVRTLLGLTSEDEVRCAVCKFTDSASALSTEGTGIQMSPRQAIEMTLYQYMLDSSLCCKLFPTEALKRTKLREGIRYEDLDCIYRIYENIEGKIAFTSAPMYLYRNNPDSFIHNFTSDRLDVLAVTDEIVAYYRNDPQLLQAARDRRFAAYFNMFILSAKAGLESEADRCWEVIKAERHDELRNPKVRRKNKIGALASYLGRSVMKHLAGLS